MEMPRPRRSSRFGVGAIALTFLVGVNIVGADEAARPVTEAIPGVATISADGLAEMLVGKNPPLVIDARIASGRITGYIENSKSLPDIHTSCESLARAIPDYNISVVFYCSSSKCGRSFNALKIARACNYKNVYWFRGGFAEWQARGYPYVKDPAEPSRP